LVLICLYLSTNKYFKILILVQLYYMLYFNCLYINIIYYIYIYNTLIFFLYLIFFFNTFYSFKQNYHKFFTKFFFINYASMPISIFFFIKNIIYTQLIYYDNLLFILILVLLNTYIIFFYTKNYNTLLNYYNSNKFIKPKLKKTFFFNKLFFYKIVM